ncbi:MAG: hypothetical protein MHM6MM_002211 [Cercozoa sp. M6MM]
MVKYWINPVDFGRVWNRTIRRVPLPMGETLESRYLPIAPPFLQRILRGEKFTFWLARHPEEVVQMAANRMFKQFQVPHKTTRRVIYGAAGLSLFSPALYRYQIGEVQRFNSNDVHRGPPAFQ